MCATGRTKGRRRVRRLWIAAEEVSCGSENKGMAVSR
jgi:hypothetical protein